MKPKLLLRLACFCILIHIIGHIFGHVNWKKSDDPVKQEVIRQMTDFKFEFMGVMRSMGDYYHGYGTYVTITLITILFILWFLSGSAERDRAMAMNVLWPLAICMLGVSIVEFIYFFPFAATISLLSSILIGTALLQLNKEKK